MKFKIESKYKPMGDQPKAIDKIVKGFLKGNKSQVLLGVTGSGKTFTMANVIEKLETPTLVLVHNKTLAAQLYQEFKEFFPNNAVEYFVSYYDYYQPEAYIARTHTYIEKALAINSEIEKLRLSATRSLLERKDVVVISSVSAIYGLGMPKQYSEMAIKMSVDMFMTIEQLAIHLAQINYVQRNDDFSRGTFRHRGEVIDIYPPYEDDTIIRIEFYDDVIESISEVDLITSKKIRSLKQVTVYPGSHYVSTELAREHAMRSIRQELELRLAELEAQGRFIERERLAQRTFYDLDMIKEMGFCSGIENYASHFSGSEPGSPPSCLMDYFPEDFLLIIDESHQTVPQLKAMYNGDRARKTALIEYGFRLPSAYDNRPLKFDETYNFFNKVLYVSATPSPWEIQDSENRIAEQIIRPTGFLDPIIEIRPAKGQMDDVIHSIRKHIEETKERVLVTTLTKKLAEDITKYLLDIGINAKYLHSDIVTLERINILRSLRKGEFDVLVGINLLREGLDLPEVSLVTILDADKEGFLRNETTLVQICGRAARNLNGKVIMYADRRTVAIENTVRVCSNRRKIQHEYNVKNGIVPKPIYKVIADVPGREKPVVIEDEYIETVEEITKNIEVLRNKMLLASKDQQYELAAKYRDDIKKYQTMLLSK